MVVRGEMSRRRALGLLAGTLAASAAPPALARTAGADPVADRLDAYLDRAMRDSDFSGVVLLARDGRTIFTRVEGLASRDHGVANRLDTQFNLASIGKTFTATAILRLVEQGRVRLDAPVGAYLPDYPDRDAAARITIEHLLTHSSGLGNYWEAIADKAPQAYVRLADFVPLFAGRPLDFAPGAQFAYSNVGYVVLGLVIEAVTGEPYQDHVRRTIFAPLGMAASHFHPLDLVVSNRATGFVRDEAAPGAWRSNQFVNQYRGNSAGGGYGSAGDLLRFADALAGNRLLGAATRANATRGRFDYARGRYGLGFSEEIVNGHRITGHSGGHIGIAGELMMFEDLGWTCVILTNGDVDAFWGVNAMVKDLIAGPSDRTRGYWLSMAMADRAAGGSVAAARLLAADLPAGVSVRASVLEVEAVKHRHRGNAAGADRIAELARAFTPA